MTEIKPCPLCGGEAKFVDRLRGDTAFVECQNGACSIKLELKWKDRLLETEDDLIARWNALPRKEKQ